jgi:GrpB-like predicted nucleotidyltransferase (UPF0157 family)
VRFHPERANREAVAAEFAAQRRAIEALLPDAEVEHIGSTAVPGALTKGDLDLLVRVDADRFEQAAAELGERYAIHQPENWSDCFASFKQLPEDEIGVGVQLVLAGSDDDLSFIGWRERLLSDAQLLEDYNALKRSQTGADPDSYIEAKTEFIESRIGHRTSGT